MLRSLFTFLAILLLFSLGYSQQAAVKPAQVTRLRGNVLSVEDSDRIKFAADDGSIYTATLLGVDAPDEKQNYYKKAKKRLSDLVEDKEVTVMLRTNERGESFAVVFVGGDDVGLKMVQDGLAWFAPRRSEVQSTIDRERYIQAETAAKRSRLGLWGDENAIAPWTFRGENDEPVVAAAESAPASNVETPKKSQPVPGRTYILGPRGGCYYLNDQGIKVYVKDKTL